MSRAHRFTDAIFVPSLILIAYIAGWVVRGWFEADRSEAGRHYYNRARNGAFVSALPYSRMDSCEVVYPRGARIEWLARVVGGRIDSLEAP